MEALTSFMWGLLYLLLPIAGVLMLILLMIILVLLTAAAIKDITGRDIFKRDNRRD